jgi:hypothetical protein
MAVAAAGGTAEEAQRGGIVAGIGRSEAGRRGMCCGRGIVVVVVDEGGIGCIAAVGSIDTVCLFV